MCTCVITIFREQVKARKEHSDDGWEEIQEWINGGCYIGEKRAPMSFAEKRQLVMMKKDRPHRIQKGQVYERQYNKMEGQTYTWRTKKLFFELMSRYDLFPEC